MADGLTPSSQGKRVAFDGPGRTVIDGPFAETRELVVGFWLWEELEFSPPVDQAQVTAQFRFQKVGQSEIKITSVTTSCGCNDFHKNMNDDTQSPQRF